MRERERERGLFFVVRLSPLCTDSLGGITINHEFIIHILQSIMNWSKCYHYTYVIYGFATATTNKPRRLQKYHSVKQHGHHITRL
jgi:hypothetical protein